MNCAAGAWKIKWGAMRVKNKLAVFLAGVFVLASGWASAAAESAKAPLPHLQIKDRRVVDDNGSVVILRGVAVNQLGDYFQANTMVPSTIPLQRRDFRQIASLGCNSVRLIVHWSLLEPSRGVKNLAYLVQVKQAVAWAKEYGIYVILDMHCDAWGKYIATPPEVKCKWPLLSNIGWDGAPEWATFTDDKSRCMLVHREMSLAVMNSWQSFWDDREGIQQHLIDNWAWLAGEFKDEPAVAGYDLINEPLWGYNLTADVNKHKPAFYKRATEAIRKAESGGMNKIIFFEPMAIWSAVPRETPKPFTKDQNIIYAPHIYLGSISIDMFLFHKEMIPLRKGFEWADGESKKFGTTFYNGEWSPGPGDHAYRYAALEDEYQIGSARWQWKISCGDPHLMSGFWPDRNKMPSGQTNDVMVLLCGDEKKPEGIEQGINPIDAVVLARPYPRAFPGPANFKSDPKKRTLEIKGDENSGDAPLIIWMPGGRRPQIEAENVKEISIEQVEGGWLIRGKPGTKSWKFFAAGSD